LDSTEPKALIYVKGLYHGTSPKSAMAIQEYGQSLRQQPKTLGDGAAPSRFEQACLIEYGRAPRRLRIDFGIGER